MLDDFEFHDVFSLEDEMWEFIPQPIYALIFLYEIKNEHKAIITSNLANQQSENKENPFFIKQTISNSCGSIALLHALCNVLE